MALSTYIRKEEKCQVNNLSFYFMRKNKTLPEYVRGRNSEHKISKQCTWKQKQHRKKLMKLRKSRAKPLAKKKKKKKARCIFLTLDSTDIEGIVSK